MNLFNSILAHSDWELSKELHAGDIFQLYRCTEFFDFEHILGTHIFTVAW